MTTKTPAEQVYSAYAALAERPGAWVSLLHIRAALVSMTHEEATAAILSIRHDKGVCIVADPNRKAIPQAARDAAVKIGPEMCDIIAIEGRPAEPTAGEIDEFFVWLERMEYLLAYRVETDQESYLARVDMPVADLIAEWRRSAVRH